MSTLPPLTKLMNEKLEEQEWTQNELANRLGIAPMSVSKWMRGKDPVPWHRFIDVSRVLHIPLVTFLRAAREQEPRHAERFERFIGKFMPKAQRTQRT